MAVFKFSNVGGFGTYQRYNDFLAGNPAVIADKGSMYPLGVFTLSSAQSTVEFTNIPQTFSHLQMRMLVRTNRSANFDAVKFQFNNDTTSGNYYRSHYFYGTGSSVSYGADGTGDGSVIYRTAAASLSSDVFAGVIVDIFDTTSTNKNKTIKYLGGADNNGTGEIFFGSSMWFPSTSSAITSIKLLPNVGTNFAANSSFALYGVQA